MGIFGLIAKTKKGFHDTRIKIIKGQTARIQEKNLAEAEITQHKRELYEAKQIHADLRAEQDRKVEGARTSKLKSLGQGLAKHMNKKESVMPRVGVPVSRVNQPVSTQQGGIFGGQRNIDVGGETESPFVHRRKRDLF